MTWCAQWCQNTKVLIGKTTTTKPVRVLHQCYTLDLGHSQKPNRRNIIDIFQLTHFLKFLFGLKTHISTKTLLRCLGYILLKCVWLCWRVFSHVLSPLLIVGPKRSRRQTGWINVVDFSVKMRKGGQKPWHRQSANKRMRCRWRGGMGKLRRMALIEGITEKERSWLAGGEGQAPPSQKTGNRKAVAMMSFMFLAFNITVSLAKAWFEACPTAVRALFELAQRQFPPLPSLLN